MGGDIWRKFEGANAELTNLAMPLHLRSRPSSSSSCNQRMMIGDGDDRVDGDDGDDGDGPRWSNAIGIAMCYKFCLPQA